MTIDGSRLIGDAIARLEDHHNDLVVERAVNADLSRQIERLRDRVVDLETREVKLVADLEAFHRAWMTLVERIPFTVGVDVSDIYVPKVGETP